MSEPQNPSSEQDPTAEENATAEQNEHSTERRHPALIATAVALPVALVIGVIVAAAIANRTPVQQPVGLGPVEAPAAESSECTTLMADLPEKLGDFTRAELRDPAPVAAAAWQQTEGEPIVMRCGLPRPPEFNEASPLSIVDGVQWFEISGAAQGMDASTWYAVDRGVYIALTAPGGSGPTPLQDASAAVAKALPAQPPDPAPIPFP
ncbi:DUF3515 domain-containing protein [Rhodococcus spongiicola]|uniref:DUF3515 domain-containing protein n=1 Tax=Rhodococcus spongiicola TaxID=2487352 RepID=A0A438B1A7_9NOCA|nr:DUF3515 domain-containing protein [Rhodococcus spongiicola]RVW04732.1 DUF3515 domain-containing protein [Rhodococcus spongiicola]